MEEKAWKSSQRLTRLSACLLLQKTFSTTSLAALASPIPYMQCRMALAEAAPGVLMRIKPVLEFFFAKAHFPALTY